MTGTLVEGLAIVPGYRLVQFLGKGGFGEVWKATGPGRVPVALKVIELKGSKAGEREFRSLDLLRDLRHPNLLPLQGYWILDDKGQVIEDDRPANTLVIAMLLGGKSLRNRMDECLKAGVAGIPPGELIPYLRDAAKGIDYLNSPRHQLGDNIVSIQHRDIKPENLLIVGDGVMLADFGIARVMEQSHSSLHTETAAMTIWYAAPELFDMKSTIWTDQYALAISYFELRTGRLPFPENCSMTAAMMVHMKSGHAFDGITDGEVHVLRRATSPVPEQRYPTCNELVAELEAALRAGGAYDAPGSTTGLGLVSTGGTRSGNRPQVTPTQAFTGGTASPASLVAADARSQTECLDPSIVRPVPQPTAAYYRDSTLPHAASIADGKTGPKELPTDRLGANTAVMHRDQSLAKTEASAPARRSNRTALAVAAVVVIALPIGWLVVNKFLPDNKTEPPSKTSAGTDSNNLQPSTSEQDTQTKPSVPAVDPVLAAREKAALALLEKRYADVVASLEPLAREGKATARDHAAIARARLGLAEHGDDPAENFKQAADSFAQANETPEQAATWIKSAAWHRVNDRPKQAISALEQALKAKKNPAIMLELSDLQLEHSTSELAGDTAAQLLKELKSTGQEKSHLTVRAHRNAARAIARLSEQLEKSDSPDATKVEELDQKAAEHFTASAALAEELKIEDAESYRADLNAFRKLPRIAKRMQAMQLQKSIAELGKELQNSPTDHVILIKLAELEANVGQAEQAAVHFVQGYSRWAIELAMAGDLDNAASAAQEAAKRDPDHVLAHFARGLIASKKGDLAAAIRDFDSSLSRAAASDPERWKTLAERGSAYARKASQADGSRDDWQHAATDLEAAIKNFPDPPDPPANRDAVTPQQRKLAELEFARGGSLEQLSQSAADRPRAEQLGADAEQAFRRASAFNPGESNYRLSAIRLLLRRGRSESPAAAKKTFAQTEQLIIELIALDPNSAEAFNLQGELSLVQGKTAKAQSAFDKAVEFGKQGPPDRLHLYCLNLANACLRNPPHFLKALAAADQAIAVDGQDPAAHFSRGLALRGLQKTSDAIAAFDAVLARAPKHPGALTAKSQIIVEMKDATNEQLEQASKDIELALKSATSDDQKAEAFYVRSLAWLKNHFANQSKPSLAETALLECQRDLLQAVKLIPSNSVYANAADQVYAHAARYPWSDKKQREESDRLQQDLKAAKKTAASTGGE